MLPYTPLHHLLFAAGAPLLWAFAQLAAALQKGEGD